jgi:hypothetical protein
LIEKHHFWDFGAAANGTAQFLRSIQTAFGYAKDELSPKAMNP